MGSVYHPKECLKYLPEDLKQLHWLMLHRNNWHFHSRTVSRAPNFATFHFCHVSDEELEGKKAPVLDGSKNLQEDSLVNYSSDDIKDSFPVNSTALQYEDISDNEFISDIDSLDADLLTDNYDYDVMTTSVYGYLPTDEDVNNMSTKKDHQMTVDSPETGHESVTKYSHSNDHFAWSSGDQMTKSVDGTLNKMPSHKVEDQMTKSADFLDKSEESCRGFYLESGSRKISSSYSSEEESSSGDKDLEAKRQRQTRKLTYSAEDVQRLAAEAELLVLQQQHQLQLNRCRCSRHNRRRQHHQLNATTDNHYCNSSSNNSSCENGGYESGDGNYNCRRRYTRRYSQSSRRRKKEWRKSLPCQLELNQMAFTASSIGELGDLAQRNGDENATEGRNNGSGRIAMYGGSLVMLDSVQNMLGSTGSCLSQDLGYESLPKLFNKDGASPTNNSPPKNALTFGDVVRMRNATGARRKKKKKSAAVVDYSSVCSSGSEWDSCHNRDRTRNINGFADGGIMIAERNNVAVDNTGVFTETSGRSSVASDSNYSSPESQLWDKEDYLSEEYQYDELLDEDGLRTLLSLGEDFSNLNQNLSTPYSSLEYEAINTDRTLLVMSADQHQESSHYPDSPCISESEKEDERGIGAFSQFSTRAFSEVKNDDGEHTDNDILPEAEHLSGKMRNSAAENIKVNIFDVAKNEEIIGNETALNLKKKIEQIRTSLQSIIANNERKKVHDSKEIQVQMDKLFALKVEIFELNLAVHKLIKNQTNSVKNGGKEEKSGNQLLNDVIDLYALLRRAKQLINKTSESKDNEKQNGGSKTADPNSDVRKRRRRRKKSGNPGEETDSGCFSETGWTGKPRTGTATLPQTNDPATTEVTTYIENKEEIKSCSAAMSGSSSSWVSRVGKFCLYTCFLVAAILPVAMMTQVECCDRMNSYRPLIQFQYSNGPPPI